MQISWSSQVDKEAAETGVEGVAGRPLRPWLPHLQAARRPHGGRGGDHLAEAGGELADLPWSIDIGIARIEDLDLAWEEEKHCQIICKFPQK